MISRVKNLTGRGRRTTKSKKSITRIDYSEKMFVYAQGQNHFGLMQFDDCNVRAFLKNVFLINFDFRIHAVFYCTGCILLLFFIVNFSFLVWKILIIAKLKKQDATEGPRDTITTLTSTISTEDGSTDPDLCSPKL